LFFELLLNWTSDFNKWGVIRRVFLVRIKLAKQPGDFIPTVSSSSNFLNFNFYTFTAFSPKQICISKVLVCNLLSFCDTFRLVYNLLRSDHNGRFLILRLYIVVVFARSLARFATTCTTPQWYLNFWHTKHTKHKNTRFKIMNHQKLPHLPVQSNLLCLSIDLFFLKLLEIKGDVKQLNIRNISSTTFGKNS